MMSKQRLLMLALCLLTALALTACHTDSDPWPVSDGGVQQQSTATPQPADIAPAAETEAAQETTDTGAQGTPQAMPPADQPDAEPTEYEDPGLNG